MSIVVVGKQQARHAYLHRSRVLKTDRYPTRPKRSEQRRDHL